MHSSIWTPADSLQHDTDTAMANSYSPEWTPTTDDELVELVLQMEEQQRGDSNEWGPLIGTQVIDADEDNEHDEMFIQLSDLVQNGDNYELTNIDEGEHQEIVSLLQSAQENDLQQQPINLNDEHLNLMQEIEEFLQEQPVQVVDTHNIIEDWQAEADEKEQRRKERGKAPSKCIFMSYIKP